MDNDKIYFYDYLIKVLSIAKIGLTYSKDGYALKDYKALEELTQKVFNNFMELDFSKPNYFERNIYPTPNVSVRGVILSKDKTKVLLVKEKKDNAYSLPGGWADLYDSPKDAVIREVKEEAGVEIKVVRLAGVFNASFKHCLKCIPEYSLIFECELVKDLHCHDFDILDVNYFDLNKLPQLSLKMTKENFNRAINLVLENKFECD